jgi:hypothetical protein
VEVQSLDLSDQFIAIWVVETGQLTYGSLPKT